jgi:hypothetical protein
MFGAETRDSVLRMILPGLLIALGYVFFFSRGEELRTAQSGLESAQASAVSEMDVAVARLKTVELAAERDGLQKEKDAVEGRWSRLTAFPVSTPAKRAAALRQLTHMLWDHDLYPFEESPAGESSQLPGSLDGVVKRLTSNGTASQPRLWQVKFYGRYADVADTLAALSDLEGAVVPVGLTMSEAKPETAWRVWTLLLWN